MFQDKFKVSEIHTGYVSPLCFFLQIPQNLCYHLNISGFPLSMLCLEEESEKETDRDRDRDRERERERL